MIAVAECTIEVLSRTIMCPALNTTHLTVKVTGFEVALIVPPTPFPPARCAGISHRNRYSRGTCNVFGKNAPR